MNTSLSLNETVSLVKLAWRGAGYPWSIAGEAGKAVGWLEEHELPGALLASTILDNLAGIGFDRRKPCESSVTLGTCWQSPASAMCPVMGGLTLLDHSCRPDARLPVQLADVYAPGLLLPYLSRLQRIKGGMVSLTCDQACACFVGDTCYMKPQASGSLWQCLLSPAPVDVNVSFVWQVTSEALAGFSRCDVSDVPRCQVDRRSLENLRRYAHKTYAPATERSRLSGAGAGVSDND